MTSSTKKLLLAAGVVAACAGGGAAIAGATGGDGDAGDNPERAIQGDALRRASAVALDHVGGGRVTETEVGDEESYYEVEVTRDDGSQVDVQLDRSFHVVGAKEDREEAGGDD